MNRTSRRGVALAVLLVGLTSWATLALPSFSDRNIAKGNLNPTDTIMVMEIRVTRGGGEDVTLASITIRNAGTAGDGDLEKLIVEDGGGVLGELDNLSGITSTNGVTIPLSFHMDNTTHYLRIFVVVGTNVDGGETVDLQALVDYTSNGTPGTSAWISDLTGETIRNGGFDEIEDNSPDAGYLNPDDQNVVQIGVFSDNDANGSPVLWDLDGATADESVIVQVENLGSATATDIDRVRVTITMEGTRYTTGWINWDPSSPMDFTYGFVDAAMPGFYRDADEDGVQDSQDPGDALPLQTEDNAATTVQTEFEINDKASVTDNRTIQTKTTVRVREEGEGSAEPPVDYEQSVTSGTTQTIREQGFEQVDEESESLASGTAATGDVVVQTVRLTDEDSNANGVQIRRFYVRNTGTAEGDEIEKIEVKAGATEILELDGGAGGDLGGFRTGDWFDIDPADYFDVDDDEEQVVKIYYTIGTPEEGHTLQPAVRFSGREGGEDYPSDEVTYPDELGLYEPGFEFVENMTPPSGGTAYSGQKLLAQRIRLEDRDEDNDDVTIDPVVVRNAGTASGNPDVTKIEIWRQDEEDGPEVKIGESSDLNGFKTGGVHVDIDNDSIVQDAADGAEIFLLVYLQIADPEDMVAGRTIQLETRVIHTENGATFDKMAESNQWTLQTNHRPVPDFTFAKATTAAVGPKADFTYEDTIRFSGTATDQDGDDIVAWHWDFGDGNTSDEQNPTHRYPNGGTFDVTLTVTDEHGVTGSVTKTIEVEGPPNEPPTIDELTADPEEPAVDEDVEFAATVTDPDQPAGTAFDYEWDFDDETTSTVANPTHSYDEEGTYTVTLTVTDAEGATDTATIEIVVGNDPPTIGGLTATPTAPGPGDTVNLTATNVTDPDDDAIDRYEWDFGDGETAETTEGNTTHVYAASGTFTVEVVAVDERGARSAAETVDVTVTGAARTILFAFPNPADATATFTYYLPDGATDPILRVYGLLGRLVLEQELSEDGTTFEWDLRTAGGGRLPNGLYFCVVTVTGANRSEVFRLLIVR
jgi:PKD repeat protein